MEFARELPECPLDVGVRGAAVDAEDLVVVALGRRHQSRGYRHPYPQCRSRRALVVLVDVLDEPGELEAAARTARIALS